MRLATSTLSSRFFDKVVDLDAACLVPTLNDPAGSTVPSISHPAQSGKAFRVVPLPPKADGEKSLYPFDACGIYSREKFTSLGGYDWTIANPYWQKMDFGMRAWLWGESIRYAQALRINYEGAPASEDTTPRSRMLRYIARSRKNPRTAWEEYKAARDWIVACSYRFKADASRLADLWDPLS
jgi:hypothetical protein